MLGQEMTPDDDVVYFQREVDSLQVAESPV